MPESPILPPDPSIDGALALAVREGRDGALERLVRGHQDELFAYAAGMLRDEADAQEVVQDAFLRAHDALVRRYDDDRCRALRLRPWLFRIVRNLALNRIRSRRAGIEPLPDSAGWHAPALAVPPASEAALDAEDARRALERALASLGREAREIVTLRFTLDLSYAEIAGMLGVTEAAARGKVFRALERLRRRLPAEEVSDAV